jgi:hypothetical protein
MDSIFKLFTGGYRGAFCANLLVSLLALVWTIGANPKKRETVSWRGWVTFWLGTCVFYLLKTIWLDWSVWWIPFSGLYVATGALLISFALSDERFANWPRIPVVASLAGLVLATVIADAISVHLTDRSGWHQALTAFALFMWAWRIRLRDVSKSIPLAAYAVLQLPLQPLLSWLGIKSNPGYDDFVLSTFAAYALLKLPLIASVYTATERVETAP